MNVEEFIGSLNYAVKNGHIKNDDLIIASCNKGKGWEVAEFVGLTLPKVKLASDADISNHVNLLVLEKTEVTS